VLSVVLRTSVSRMLVLRILVLRMSVPRMRLLRSLQQVDRQLVGNIFEGSVDMLVAGWCDRGRRGVVYTIWV
jgi:hypothetical protein